MVRLTLRMMERSCFWARIWAISYRGRKKRREIEIERRTEFRKSTERVRKIKMRHNNIPTK